MDDPSRLCELHRLDDLDRLSDVEAVLQAHGIDTDIQDESGGWSLRPHRGSLLMVRCRDLIYARWVAYEAGLDTWPDDTATAENG